MELTFLVSGDGANLKRVQARRACDACRRRKEAPGKETPLSDISTLTRSQSPSLAARREASVRSRSASPRGERSSVSSLQITGSGEKTPGTTDADVTTGVEESRRFACDSNPMATLIDQDEARLQKGRCQQGDVGAWLTSEETSIEQERSFDTSPQTSRSHVHPDMLPPRECQEALIDIYLRRIHPILPLFNEEKVRSQHEKGILPLRLVQAMCLVASKDRDATHFLCLGSQLQPLPLERFSNILYADIIRSIPRRTKDKVLAIQILALLSLHEWGSAGSEDCALNLAQAIHHAHTIGLHLMRPDQHADTSSKGLFWCLWSLDRWNAAMNGRPVMIHDEDMGQGVGDVVSTFQPPFCVWLQIADRLGEVIKGFRPIRKDADPREIDLPSFEELVDYSKAGDMAPELLGSLDLIYHSVIILSTYSSGLQGRSRPRLSNIRQSHSILSIASLSCNQDIRNFLPVPMIGYTISLAFSVTYKQLRESKLPSTHHTAICQIRLFHQSLKRLGSTWWSADVMARLGQRVLNNIQPTVDQERFTDPEVDITRLNSQPESSHISPHPVISTDSLQLHMGVGSAHVGRRIEVGYQSAHPPDHHLASGKPSDSDGASTPFLTATEIESFDTFFGNFLDVGLPSCANDQWLLDLDMSDFEFRQNALG